MDLSKNFFELFGLPAGFEVDRSQLDSQYRSLQREFHPDRFAHLSDAEQLKSVQAATHINSAYDALKSPIKRAQYLLSLQGIETGEESRKQLPVAFLMEQMELREALVSVPKASDPFAALASLEREAKSLEKNCLDGFVASFNSGDMEMAEEAVRKLQFLNKLILEVGAMEERLEEEF